jgi:hypothetical protein
MLLDICNDVYKNKTPPKQWATNIIIPVPKNGYSNIMSNFGGISLMSHVVKLYNRILLNRIYDEVNKKLQVFQAGFRRSMNCIQQISILRRVLEGAQDRQLPYVATFIDFSKAFDSINRECMWKILELYGIPDRIINAIKCLYTNSTSQIAIESQISDEFKITTGILQGDTLAPFLFIIVLDYVISKSSASYGLITNSETLEKINILAYVDDIVMINKSTKEARSNFNKIRYEAYKVGLKINLNKTKIMTNIVEDKYLKKLTRKIDVVTDFKYLGSYIYSSLNDFKERRNKAWQAFWLMKKLWLSTDVHLSLKLKILQSTCFSILLYASESWTITPLIKRMLDSFALSCYRYILGKRKLDKIKTSDILKQVRKEPLSETVQGRQLKFIGKCLRSTTNLLVKKYILYYPEYGSRKRGRPRLTFVDYIEKLTNIKIAKIAKLANDKSEFELFILDVLHAVHTK